MNAPIPYHQFETVRVDEGAARLQRRTRQAGILLALLVFGFFGLAALLQIGGAVVGGGEIAVESNVRTVSHPEGGILGAVLVRDGDHVAKDQVLMRFDTAVSQTGSQSAGTGLDELLARRARLQAERDGEPVITFPSELTGATDPRARDLMAREQRLFALRRAERDGAYAQLGQRIRQYESAIGSYQVQIAAIDRQRVLITPELAGLRKLHDKQLVPINRLNEMERTAVQLDGSRGALELNIAQTRAQIAEMREQMLNIDKSRRSDAGTELDQVTLQLNDQRVRYASARDTYARSVIRAPQSGTVDKIAYTTVGSSVPPHQPILQIVPDRDSLIVEARIRPQDVDQVHVGQAARVLFTGLERQTTPEIPGKLIFVSPELTQDQRTGAAYYRIKVQLDAAAMKAAPQIALKAGMPAEVFVQTGSRSILSFLLKPLFDQLRYSMREG